MEGPQEGQEEHRAERGVNAPAEEEATRDADGSRGPKPIVILAIISVLVAIGVVIAIFNLSGEPRVPGDAPDRDWDRLDLAAAQDVALKSGRHEATVIIAADEDTCWAGYIVSKEVKGCGNAVFDVSGAPATFGANVRQTDSDVAFLGIAVWSDGERIDRAQTNEPSGVASVTVPL